MKYRESDMRDHTMRNEKYLKDRDELIRKKTEQHDHTHTHTLITLNQQRLNKQGQHTEREKK
jgi:hypothetical protein